MSRRLFRYLKPIISLNIIGSLFLSILLAISVGSIVSRSEGGMINKIRNDIEENAIILSTQKFNNVMVERYTGREFLVIKLPDSIKDNFNHPDEFTKNLKNYINAAMESGEIAKNPKEFPIINKKLIEVIEEFKVSEYGQIKRTEKENLLLSTEIKPSQKDLLIEKNIPIYLLYSFAKTDGFLNKVGRKYWSAGIDPENRDWFYNIQNDGVSYKDRATILIKIR